MRLWTAAGFSIGSKRGTGAQQNKGDTKKDGERTLGPYVHFVIGTRQRVAVRYKVLRAQSRTSRRALAGPEGPGGRGDSGTGFTSAQPPREPTLLLGWQTKKGSQPKEK